MWRIRKLLENVANADRQNLASILQTDDSPEELTFGLAHQAQDVLQIQNTSTTYGTVVRRLAKEVGVGFGLMLPLKSVEDLLVQTVFKDAWSKMNQTDRERLAQEIHSISTGANIGNAVGTAGVYAALAGAQMSGLGVYMMATTVLGGVTSAIGITLPFAANIGLSQAISLVIGPVGWIALAFFSIGTFHKSKNERQRKEKAGRVLSAVLLIIALKRRNKETRIAGRTVA